MVDFLGTIGPVGGGKITAGSIAGAGNYFLGANQLTVGSSDLSTEVSGVIADGGQAHGVGGSLIKTGAGTLTLSGVNTYTGGTNVNSGTLNVIGSIARSSLTAVNNGGTLVGTGTAGNVQINSGGTFAPGALDMPGTSMTVSGNLLLQSGSIYSVQVNPFSATSANVTGTASLSGEVLLDFASGSYLPKEYDILHSAGLSAYTVLFEIVDLLSGFTASVTYTNTDMLLDLLPVSATPLPPTWTMMLIGLAGLGFVAHRGSRKSSLSIVAA